MSMDPKSTKITHIGVVINADEGEVWASISRCNAFGLEVSSASEQIRGRNMVAVIHFLDLEINRYQASPASTSR